MPDYIRYISPDGSDSSSGLTWDTAWKTLPYAISELELLAGDVELICDEGQYEVITAAIETERNTGESITIRLREDATEDAIFTGNHNTYMIRFNRSDATHDDYDVIFQGVSNDATLLFEHEAVGADQVIRASYNGTFYSEYAQFNGRDRILAFQPTPANDMTLPLEVTLRYTKASPSWPGAASGAINGSRDNLVFTGEYVDVYSRGNLPFNVSYIFSGGGTVSLTGCTASGSSIGYGFSDLFNVFTGTFTATSCSCLETIFAIDLGSGANTQWNKCLFYNSISSTNYELFILPTSGGGNSTTHRFTECVWKTSSDQIAWGYDVGNFDEEFNLIFDRCLFDGRFRTSTGPYIGPDLVHANQLELNFTFLSCLVTGFNSGPFGFLDFDSAPGGGSASLENCTLADNQYGVFLPANNDITLINTVVEGAVYSIRSGGTYPDDYIASHNIFIGPTAGSASVDISVNDKSASSLEAAGLDPAFLIPESGGLCFASGTTSSASLISYNGQTWRTYGDGLIDRGAFSFVEDEVLLHAPQLTAPRAGTSQNLGTINITWTVPSRPSDDTTILTGDMTFELEYTDNYAGDETNWFSIKRRLPWSSTSYSWKVGKSIKSKNVRIRIRSRHLLTGNISEWNVVGGDVIVNVFKLSAPIIVSPVGGGSYSDHVLIILDESNTTNTFHQKVRYKLEYSSGDREVDWTTIVEDVPPGESIIRWDLSDISPSSDYVLRLTVWGAVTEGDQAVPNQFDSEFVRNITIEQPGVFVIDTLPPEAVIQIDNDLGATNQLNQPLSIFAEDATTEVIQMQLRECDATYTLELGDQSSISESSGEDCPAIEDLLTSSSDVDHLIGKPMPYTPKLKWTFEDSSGVRKIEGLFTDAGGNLSVQEDSRVFLTSFKSTNQLADFLIAIEQRETTVVENTDDNSESVTLETSLFEVAYIATSSGELWILEPLPRLVYSFSNNQVLTKIYKYSDSVYVFSYSSLTSYGSIWRIDSSEASLVYQFTTVRSQVNAVTEYGNTMYVGLDNGELWTYNGYTTASVNSFSDSISYMYADQSFLYIGFYNSDSVVLYDGSSFYTQTLGS